jgi:hypothetical protein
MAGGSRKSGWDGGGIDDFNRATLFRSALGHKRRGTYEALEAGFFFEYDRAGAEKLAEHVAMEHSRVGVDGLHEFDHRGFFHAEGAAADRAGDPTAGANHKITGAIDIAVESSKNCEVMAAHGRVADSGVFSNDDVAARLDTAVQNVIHIIVDEANVFAALRALAGLCFCDGMEGMGASEAKDIARGLAARQQSD